VRFLLKFLALLLAWNFFPPADASSEIPAVSTPFVTTQS
jgi:hypothetical protein